MISKIIDGASRRSQRLFQGILSFAILVEVTGAATASFAQPPGAAAGPPYDASAVVKRPDARHLVDVRAQPYQAIGQLVGPTTCTGAIVLHPRIVLTTAYCVVGLTGPSSSWRLFFRPGYEGGVSLGTFEGKVEAIGSTRQREAQSIHDASEDWAILVLDKGPAGVRPLGVAEHTLQELQSMQGRILLPSYSRDMAHGQALSVDPSCSIEGIQWEVLLHNCSAGAGSSGAPLLIREQNCYKVVGIHSGAMLVDDHENHTMVGNSAIGTWNFASQLQAVQSRLDVEEGIETRPSKGCFFDMVSGHDGALGHPRMPSTRL